MIFNMLFCRFLIGRQLWSSNSVCVKNDWDKEWKRRGVGRVICAVFLVTMCCEVVPKLYPSLSQFLELHKRLQNAHKPPSAERRSSLSGLAGPIAALPNRAKFSARKRSAVAPTAAPHVTALLFTPAHRLSEETGEKTQHDPHVAWRRRRGETLPVVTATKRKKEMSRSPHASQSTRCEDQQ